MSLNESGIHPVGERILIQPMELEEKTASGIVISTNAGREREEMSNTTGVVVELSPEAYSDRAEPWCKAGDTIIFAKFAGLLYKGKDGKKYRVIRDEDVTGVLDEDVKLVDPYISRGYDE
jgi:chaperonin GroES